MGARQENSSGNRPSNSGTAQVENGITKPVVGDVATKTACETKNRPYIIAYNTQVLSGFVYQPRCGKWTCPYCADLNRDDWSQTAVYGMTHFPPESPTLKFVTITSRGYISPARSLVIFKVAWPKLIKRIAYNQSTKPEYMLIPEHHKSGVLHAHFLITADHHSNHWWHDQAFYSGMGYQAKEKNVRDPVEAGHYVAKELTKQLFGKPWPRGFRRVRLSLLWPRPPQGERLPNWEYETEMSEGRKNWTVALLRDEGYTIRDVGDPA